MKKQIKTILSIESSCDETACAILQKEGDRITILSNIVSSSLLMHAKYGGVIPEQAAREQLRFIIPAIEEALETATLTPSEIDAIAVTYGPGLIGSLLIGVETAKVLSLVWNKPLIPVNHLIGHFYANWIDQPTENKFSLPKFPCLGLLVSGGHTDIVLFKKHGEYEYLGGTRDDAAGECFDKCARILGFAYPGGPKIANLAQKGSPTIDLPIPMHDSKDSDFSFSGLKTAFLYYVEKNFQLKKGSFNMQTKTWEQIDIESQLSKKQMKNVYDLCASLEYSIVKSLTQKTIKAAIISGVEHIIVAGGVAANNKLITKLREKFHGQVYAPPPNLCTDNAAMIAAAAFFLNPVDDPLTIQANPNLSLAY